MTAEIDVRLVRSLVAGQFPQWAELPVRAVVPGGSDNRTFHLGDGMSVRLPSAERYAAQVHKEHRWLPVLAPSLPVPIPTPIAMGAPALGYPWHWSIYRWLPGESAAAARIADLPRFAADLARFLRALHRADATGVPAPGRRNFFRGGTLAVYDAETRAAITALAGTVDAEAAWRVWAEALASSWSKPPVWVHGDVSAGNLLVEHGRLAAVIDFGCLAVGDPACDLTIAWTLFSGASRAVFVEALNMDPDTWRRARGWALWKALITFAGKADTDPGTTAAARGVLVDVIADGRGPEDR